MPHVLTRSPGARFRGPRAIVALVLREIATSHGRAAGGHLWAIVEPVGGIALLSVLFSLAFSAPPLDRVFALFYASGILPFMLYLDLSQKLSVAIRFNKPLLFYPGVTLADALIARLVLGVLTHLVVWFLVLGGIHLCYGIRFSGDLVSICLAFGLTTALAVGVGTLNCLLITVLPVWERLWSIANRPLFVVSTIFFLFDDVARPWRDWLWFNPLVHAIGQMRRGLFPAYRGDFVSTPFVFGLALLSLATGLLLLRRWYRDAVNS